jgi:hypothetical protein
MQANRPEHDLAFFYDGTDIMAAEWSQCSDPPQLSIVH